MSTDLSSLCASLQTLQSNLPADDLTAICAQLTTCVQTMESLVDSCEPTGTRITIRILMNEIQAVLREIHCHSEKINMELDNQIRRLRQWLQHNVVEALCHIQRSLECQPAHTLPHTMPPMDLDWEACEDLLDALRLHYVHCRYRPGCLREHVDVLCSTIERCRGCITSQCSPTYLENVLYYCRCLHTQFSDHPTVCTLLTTMQTDIQQILLPVTCAPVHAHQTLQLIDISKIRLPFALSGPDIYSRVERRAILYMIIPPQQETIVFHCDVFSTFQMFRNFLYSLYHTQPYFMQLSKRDQFVLAKWNIVSRDLRALLFDDTAMRYYDRWIQTLS